MFTEEKAREMLAEEMNATRTPAQRPITPAMFENPAYASYIAAMKRAFDAGMEWQQELSSYEF